MLRPSLLPDAVAVMALDGSGRVGATAVTGPDGGFTLDLPEVGEWTIRAERLGYGTAEHVLTFAGSETVELSLVVAPDPAAREVGGRFGDRRCPAGSASPESARLWLIARPILASVARAVVPEGMQFRTVTREFDFSLLQDETLEEARAHPRSRTSVLTFADRPPAPWGADPASVLTTGFIAAVAPEGENLYVYDYHLPGPPVLLTDAFVSTHCFFPTNGPGREDWTGLGFAPNIASELEIEVAGTIWLPRTNDGTPSIEFRYTAQPRDADLWDTEMVRGPSFGSIRSLPVPARLRDRLGGRVEMGFADAIGWIVTGVSVSTPVVGYDRIDMLSGLDRDAIRVGRPVTTPSRRFVRRVWFVRNLHEWSVRVERVEGPDGRTIPIRGRGAGGF